MTDNESARSDHDDAADITAIARACISRDLPRPRAVRIMRRAIEECWDLARQSRQGHRTYRRDALWSREASELREQDTTGLLIQEHVVPASLLAHRILDHCDGGAGESATLEALVASPLAIITKEQDKRYLGRRKADLGFSVKQEMPPSWQWGDNPWMRYVVCGFPGFDHDGASGQDAGFVPFEPLEPTHDDRVV